MTTSNPIPRAFVRHPADIPIEIAPEEVSVAGQQRLKNIGVGGLALESGAPFDIGALVRVVIPLVRPAFEARARVVWCHRHGPEYDIGVQFVEAEDAFAARMVEQICHIEHYRTEVRQREGRFLDGEAAAAEWISKYAADFPKGKGQ